MRIHTQGVSSQLGLFCHFQVSYEAKANSEFGRDSFQLDVKGAHHGGRCHAVAWNIILHRYVTCRAYSGMMRYDGAIQAKSSCGLV